MVFKLSLLNLNYYIVKNKLFLLLMLLISSSILSQKKAPSNCGSCNDSQNVIEHIGNGNFVSSTAQAYYWEICNGSAIINGLNTNQNVSVSCTSEGNFTIKVTRFIDGNCVESCEVYNCNDIPCPSCNVNCPTSNSIHYVNEGGGGLCTTGLASISGLNNVNYVNWTWALGGYSGSIENASTTTPIYYPAGDWTNYYISICAQVVFNDGTVCDFVCKSFLLDCGNGNGPPVKKINIYPNPTKGIFNLKQKNNDIKISNITITDMYGNIIKSIKRNFKKIDLSNENKGLYFIKIVFDDGNYITETVVID